MECSSMRVSNLLSILNETLTDPFEGFGNTARLKEAIPWMTLPGFPVLSIITTHAVSGMPSSFVTAITGNKPGNLAGNK